MDTTTQQVARQQYTPYGQQRSSSNTTTWPDTTHSYLGKPQDTSTGYTDVGARKYDPTLGRFISIDPLLTTRDPTSLNGYSYAGNSPVTTSDPSGLCHPDQCGIGYPIGGAIGDAGDNGIPKEYVKKAPHGAGGVDAPGYSGAGYVGDLPAAAHGDSNNMVKDG